MSQITKTIRTEIIKPIDIDWKLFSEILMDIRFQTRFIMNKTIQLLWEFYGFASDYKEKNGLYPKDKETLQTSDGNPVTIAGFIYDYLKDKHSLYTSNASQSQQKAIKKWNADKKEVLKGTRSIASYKTNLPIDLYHKCIEIEKNKNGYTCNLKLLNKAGIKKYELKSSSVQIAIKAKDPSTKSILSRLITGEYKLGGSQIVQKNRKWFLFLTYSFKKTSVSEYSKENILGVDMGVVCPVFLAVNNSPAREKIEGGEIEHFRSKVEKRRISLLRQGKYAGEGRIGHGRSTRVSPIEKLSEKVSNFRKTINYKYARFVVDFARKNNCGVIQMEDLSGIAVQNSFLKKWSYDDLQRKIIERAKFYGIEVRKINPNYTSQRCSCCGFIDESNRPKETKGQAYFKCQNCGFETNADYNAAKNLSMEGIDNIIKEELEAQSRAYVHHLKYE